MQLKGALEDNILTLLCWSERHCATAVLRLSPTLFSTRVYQQIAERAFEHVRRYSAPPKGHIRDLLEDDLRKGEHSKFLGRTIDAMEELAADYQEEYVVSCLDRYIQQRNIALAIEKASDALQAGDVEQAKEALYIADLGGKPASPGLWVHDPDAMLSFLEKRDENIFSSGIQIFDERGVTPARKELWIFMAPAKRGKSWHLLEIGKVNMLRGKSVLHLSLENSEEVTARRYVQALFALTKDRAKTVRTAMFTKSTTGQCTSIEYDTRTADGIEEVPRMKLADKLRAFGKRGRLLIKEFPTRTLTMPQLIAYLDMLEKTMNFRPDMIIVDYPDLMKVKTENLRVDLGTIFQELRGVGVQRNAAMVVATQGNRVSASARVVNETMVAEDYSKIGTADVVIAYSQTGEERRVGLARLLVSNARNAEDKWIALISQSYATGQFCIDSVFMNRYLESEIEKLSGNEEGPDDEVG